MTLATDVQKLEPGSIVELFELDLTPFGGDLLRFHAGTNGLLANVTWDGNVYTAFPVAASGFEFNGQGQAPRPKLMVSNVVGAITALVLQYEDLVGAKVTRRRTLAKYLDAVNFPARRNLLTYTESMDNAVWLKSGSTVSADSTLAPNGTLTADSLIESTITNTHQAYQNAACVAGITYTFSVYAKQAVGDRRLNFTFTGAAWSSEAYAVFNLATMTAASNVGITAFIESVGNGWYRLSASRQAASTATSNCVFRLATGDGLVFPAYSGDGISGIDLWGAQFESASIASDYQPVLAAWSQNPTADPSAEFPADIFFIDRKSVETNEIVEFELAPAMDITGVMLPRRQIIQNICPWRYRSSECGYTGSTYFDANDVSVGTLALDVCGKRLGSCKARFGQYAELPFGGFPVAGLFR